MKKCTFIIFCLVSSLYFVGCRTYPKKLKNPKPLTEKTLFELNGKYEVKAIEDDSLNNSKTRQIWMYSNFFHEIDRRHFLFDTLQLDSNKTYHFGLEVINPKRLKVNYIVQDTVFRSIIIRCKLKKDGYLYLKNKNFRILFIPYIAGSIDIKKSRLSLSENGNLIHDSMHHISGGLLVLMSDGSTSKGRSLYPRTK